MEYVEYAALLLAPFVFAAWRVTDGGWHRLPGSTIIGWALPALTVGALTLDPILGVLAIILGRQNTVGYEDWDDEMAQLLRCLPAATACCLAASAGVLGFADISYIAVGVGLAAVVVTNLIQPWLREWSDGKGWWPEHSNRYAETLEGFGVGVCSSSIAFAHVF